MSPVFSTSISKVKGAPAAASPSSGSVSVLMTEIYGDLTATGASSVAVTLFPPFLGLASTVTVLRKVPDVVEVTWP